MDFSLLENVKLLATYPMSVVQVLIQIGYEPVAPVLSSDIFSRERYYLPNKFQYMKHLRSIDGMWGLYRGFGMRMIENTVGTVVYNWVADMEEQALEEELELDMNQNKVVTDRDFFLRKMSREINSICWAIIVSHPFHVMTLRCIAQFVGRETNYSSWNLYKNTLEIYKSEGVSGFFNGFIPRLVFQVSTIIVANSMAYHLRKCVKNDDKLVKYTDTLSSIFAYLLTSPLSVATTISSISGSGLSAARPPNMPNYSSWFAVVSHLYQDNGLMRGLSVFLWSPVQL